MASTSELLRRQEIALAIAKHRGPCPKCKVEHYDIAYTLEVSYRVCVYGSGNRDGLDRLISSSDERNIGHVTTEMIRCQRCGADLSQEILIPASIE